ncbi:AbiU2 domain-containing protein [Clostridium sporogenes]|uniref:AbiU2 domain-containing protein n=1 Tax=Clostridium sporogenes TaxID=1509 RepID=UPI002238988D|nr:hypothetical protein [Clostridium sporogenes]MCW6088164.1 hypothetical protein [Clostridium sporogenes]
MSQEEKMKKDLLDEVNAYISQLVYLKDVHAVYDHIDKLKPKLQSAPNFTLITEAALIDSLMMTLARFYDKSEKAKTIPELIKKCKKNVNLFFPKQNTLPCLEKFETKLKEDEYIWTAIPVILHRRDSIFAHNDKKFFGEKIKNDKTYLPFYKIWALVDFTEEILNYLFSQLSSDERIKTKYNSDLENLFK